MYHPQCNQSKHNLSWEGGYIHSWAGRYLILSLPVGVPHPVLAKWDWGTPGRDLEPVTGVLPERTWDQWKYYGMEMGYPQKGHGTSGSIMGWRWGTPPYWCEVTHKLKTLPSPAFGCQQLEMHLPLDLFDCHKVDFAALTIVAVKFSITRQFAC